MRLMSVFALVLAGPVLVGCAGSQPAPTHSAKVVLTVHLGLFGGPARPDGGMADSDAPQPNAPITVTSKRGDVRTSKTNRDGVATFFLRPGRYTVDSPSCGHGPQQVTVTPGKPQHVEVRCDIP